MKNFTLLELMVIIAILGILITVLLPSLQNSRHYARVVVCASNIQQNSYAVSAYSKENNFRVPPKSDHSQPQYQRYFASRTYGNEKYVLLGKVWSENYMSSPETIFCPQANIDAKGTLRSFSYYLVNEKFDPFTVLAANGKKAGRSTYTLYPYAKSSAEWKSLTIAQMENDEMWLSDNLWNSQHFNSRTHGWNVSKVDLSLKYVKNNEVFSYIEANSDIWSNWGKCNTVRNALLNDF